MKSIYGSPCCVCLSRLRKMFLRGVRSQGISKWCILGNVRPSWPSAETLTRRRHRECHRCTLASPTYTNSTVEQVGEASCLAPTIDLVIPLEFCGRVSRLYETEGHGLTARMNTSIKNTQECPLLCDLRLPRSRCNANTDSVHWPYRR